MSSQVVCQDLRSLLVFCKVPTLVKATGSGRVHEEVRWSVQFNDQPTRPWWRTVGARSGIARFQLYALDVRERKFDLVAGRIIVDVVSDAGLVGRVEDDEIHGVLPNSSPSTDTQGAAGEVVDDYNTVSKTDCGAKSRQLRTNFASSIGISIHHHAAATKWHHGSARSTQQLAREWSARLHGLHGQQLSHGFWNAVTIFSSLNALLGNHLYLGPSAARKLVSPKCPSNSRLCLSRPTCFETRFAPTAPSC